MERTVNLNSRKLCVFSLVLAAGRADRFGGPKQLAEYEGQSLLRRVLQLAADTTDSRSVLVIGAAWQRMIEDCRAEAPFIVRNERFDSGMASSIACGIRAIEPVADAALILLADQPLITTDHLQALQNAWQESPASIVATEFDGISGPPVIFPAIYFGTLLTLRGDRGARSIIKDNEVALIKVPFADAAIDIDSPQDLQRL